MHRKTHTSAIGDEHRGGRVNITPSSLMSPQSYARFRHVCKQQMIRHRRERSLTLGPCMRLQFEDEWTVRYQIHEVLHAERAHSTEAVAHEIATYSHLVPDGSNWKATLQIELPDALERRRELPQLNLAVHHIYVDVARSRVFASANEDLPCRHRNRPSAVHFLRFQFTPAVRAALLAGAAATIGCAHDHYEFRRAIPRGCGERLRHDLMLDTAASGAETAGKSHTGDSHVLV